MMKLTDANGVKKQCSAVLPLLGRARREGGVRRDHGVPLPPHGHEAAMRDQTGGVALEPKASSDHVTPRRARISPSWSFPGLKVCHCAEVSGRETRVACVACEAVSAR